MNFDTFDYSSLKQELLNDHRYVKLKLFLLNYDYIDIDGRYVDNCIDIWANILLLIYGIRSGFIVRNMNFYDLGDIINNLIEFSTEHCIHYKLKILPLFGDAIYITTYYNYYNCSLILTYMKLHSIKDSIEREIIIKELISSMTSESTDSNNYYVHLIIRNRLSSRRVEDISLMSNNIEIQTQTYLTIEYYYRVIRVLMMDDDIYCRIKSYENRDKPKDLDFANKEKFDYEDLILETSFDRLYEINYLNNILKE